MKELEWNKEDLKSGDWVFTPDETFGSAGKTNLVFQFDERIEYSLHFGHEPRLFKIDPIVAEFINANKDGWVSVDEKQPERIGDYLVVCNDGLIMVAHVVANGWWSRVPDATHYTDLGKQIVLDSVRQNREVTHWMPLPPKPQI